MGKYKYILLGIWGMIAMATTKAGAQYENVWTFGANVGLNFNSSIPLPLMTDMNSMEANASVCSSTGQLLFYTNGNVVWDRNNDTMPNGTALITDFTYPSGYGPPTGSTSQGALIVPMPDSAGKYYVFSLTAVEMQGYAGRLYYSVVNMNLNGGLGDVEPGRKGILLDSMLSEQMTAAIGDRCNIWVVTAAHTNTAWHFKSFEVSSSGISTTPTLSSFGIPITSGANPGTIDISTDGKKLALAWIAGISIWGRKELYDFNVATGAVTNRMVLDSLYAGYGVCFSPDNTKLYVSSLNSPVGLYSISQYNLTSNNAATIIGTKTTLDTLPMVTHLKRAPDGMIYYIADYTSHIGRIQFPNLAGFACSPDHNAIPLATGSLGLPNIVPIIKRDTVHTLQPPVKAPCFATNVILQAANDTTAWGYQWSTGATGPAAVANTPGTYWVSYHEPPCVFHVDTFIAQFPNGMLPSIATIASCWNTANGKAFAYTYSGDTVNYYYVWKNASGDTLSVTDTLSQVPSGNYQVHIATYLCDTMLSLYIPEDNSKVSFTADSIVCEGRSISFQNTTSSGFQQYAWDFGDGDGSTLEDPVHTYLQPGYYHVRLTGTGGRCNDTAYRAITVDSLLSGSFVTNRDSICTGQSISFYPQTDGSTASLNWQLGDDTYLNTPAEPIEHAYDKDGTLTVVLTSRFRACPDTTFAHKVYVYPPPLVNLGPDSGLCLNGVPIFLQNLQPPPEDIYQRQWNTGDTTAMIKVVHPGTFSLTLRSGPLGCSTTETIEVHKDCYIDIPNAFTPNGDGVNDYFFPRQLLSRKVTAFSMQLFNRWGQLIFETTKTDGRGWDGRFNDKEQPVGVYVYQIEVTVDGVHQERYQGNVTLMR